MRTDVPVLLISITSQTRKWDPCSPRPRRVSGSTKGGHRSPREAWWTDPSEVKPVILFKNCITQHASCSQVNCQRSLSSKIFESSQAVMKETSSSLGTSWKVRPVDVTPSCSQALLTSSTCASGGAPPPWTGGVLSGRISLQSLEVRQVPQQAGQVLLHQA